MYRAGCPAPDLNTLAEPLKKNVLAPHESINDFTCGKITQHMITSLDISASQLRHLIKTGHSTQFLLPPNVLAYIKKHGLYDYPGHYSANHSTEISKI
jgi:nicotinate-nucleotide adenylyltransferase